MSSEAELKSLRLCEDGATEEKWRMAIRAWSKEMEAPLMRSAKMNCRWRNVRPLRFEMVAVDNAIAKKAMLKWEKSQT